MLSKSDWPVRLDRSDINAENIRWREFVGKLYRPNTFNNVRISSCFGATWIYHCQSQGQVLGAGLAQSEPETIPHLTTCCTFYVSCRCDPVHPRQWACHSLRMSEPTVKLAMQRLTAFTICGICSTMLIHTSQNTWGNRSRRITVSKAPLRTNIKVGCRKTNNESASKTAPSSSNCEYLSTV